jgi:hypothetical protein
LLLTLQFPAPSHHIAGVKVFAFGPVVGQDCPRHTVIFGNFSHPPLPSQLPSLPHVDGAARPHWPVESDLPAAMGVQVPAEPASAHETQGPSQTALQQTPSFAQTRPVLHWLLAVHEPPGPLRPHEPFMHVALGAHVMMSPQLTLQLPAPLQEYGKHDVDVGVEQWPAPSQVDCAVDVVVPTGQVASLHLVPDAYFWQAPPMQLPFVPQLAAPWSAHTPFGSAAPVATFAHVPSVPLSAHDLHDASHAVLQQRPCAQMFEPHSLADEHGAPGSFLPHELLLQTLGDTQFAAVVHESKHLLPLHAKGVHTRVAGATHWPVLLHVGGPV